MSVVEATDAKSGWHRSIAVFGKLRRQSTLVAAAVFGASGAAFALGNLLLARELPVEVFGRFALAIALYNIFVLLVPVGIDQLFIRHRIDPGPRLLSLIGSAGLLLGTTAGVGAIAAGGLPPREAGVLAAAIGFGGIVTAVIGLLRAAGRSTTALLFATGASWMLLCIGTAAVIFDIRDAFVPLSLFAAGNIMMALAGSAMALQRHRVPVGQGSDIVWREAFPLLGIAALGTVVLQIERLIIPIALDFRALATFGVLTSVALFPFRLVTAGAGFALTPKLRMASDAGARRRLVHKELKSLVPLIVLMSAAVVLLAPAATTLLTNGAYQIGYWLAGAACLNGASKVLQVFPRAIVTACGTSSDIATLNWFGLMWLATAVAGAAIGSFYGLEGLLVGVSLGGLLATGPALVVARRSLRR